MEFKTDKQKLARVHNLWKQMIECECGGLCFRCTDRLAEIGNVSEYVPTLGATDEERQQYHDQDVPWGKCECDLCDNARKESRSDA